MNQECPSCGNYVEGKKKATFARKMTRGIVRKGGTSAAGALIGTMVGGPVGTILGIAAGALLSDSTNKTADEMYDAAVGEIEYEYFCPKCGRKWTKKVCSNLQNQRFLQEKSHISSNPSENTSWQEKFNDVFNYYCENANTILSSTDIVKKFIADVKYIFQHCYDDVICSEYYFLCSFACLDYTLNNKGDNSLIITGQNNIKCAIWRLDDEEYKLTNILFDILAIDIKTSDALEKIRQIQLRCPDILAMQKTLFKTEYWQNVYEEACYNQLLDAAIYFEEQNKDDAVIDALQRISELTNIAYKIFAYRFLSAKFEEVNNPGQSFEYAQKAVALANFEKDYNPEFPMHNNWLECVNQLGYCYCVGIGTEINYNKAVELFQKCADLGMPVGMANLAECYELGHGVTQNLKTALELYKKAADLGFEAVRTKVEELEKKCSIAVQQAPCSSYETHTNCFISTSEPADNFNWSNKFWKDYKCYFDTQDKILSTKKSVKDFIEELTNNMQGCNDKEIRGHYLFFISFICLQYSVRNWNDNLFDFALSNIKLALSNNDNEEYRLLSAILHIAETNENSIFFALENLDIESVQSELINAEYWKIAFEIILWSKIVDFLPFYEKTNEYAKLLNLLFAYDFEDIGYKISVCNLISYTYENLGDYSKKFEYVNKAVELADFEKEFDPNDPDHSYWLTALENLGDCYEKGHGVEKDLTKAFEIYTRCANLGSALAMYNLGDMYEKGVAVGQNYSVALDYYNRALNAGFEDVEEDIKRVVAKELGTYIPQKEEFYMDIEDVFEAPNRRFVIVGQVDTGCINVGDKVVLTNYNISSRICQIIGIEMLKKTLNRCEEGDNVEILLKGIDCKDEIRRGAFVEYYDGETPVGSYTQDCPETSEENGVTSAEQEYIDELKTCIEDDGEISPKERRLLERFREKLGISAERAKELEELFVVPQLTDEEKEYLEEYKSCIEDDGKISPKERRLLNRIRESLGISEERANEIEKL